MAPSSSTQFIEAALSSTSPFALSYTDPNQKLLIRKHLLSLLQEFPTFIPSTYTFVHDDGATVNLLNATGYLHISNSAPPIPLTIWLHENYPKMAPIVFIRPDPINPIHQDHPFVDPSSGATISPYIETWLHPGCTLNDLVHNLVKIFSLDHPFFYCPPISSFSTNNTHPSLLSKREALDRLGGSLHCDLAALEAETVVEIAELSKMQVEMVKRVDITTSIIIGLEHEKMNLKRRVLELEGEVDVLTNWLKVYDPKSVVSMAGDGIEGVFEGVGDEAQLVLELLSADKAMEDLIYALDKAVEEGVVSFELYIRQVRILAREQFSYRAKLVKLKGSNIFHWSCSRD